jgi:hypothetical protein
MHLKGPHGFNDFLVCALCIGHRVSQNSHPAETVLPLCLRFLMEVLHANATGAQI